MALTPEEAVAVLLDASAAVLTARGTGDKFFIGLDLVPQGKVRPYQHCIVTDTDPLRHLGGRNSFVQTSFDLDNYADTTEDCMTLARVTRNALEGTRQIVTNDADTLDVKYLHWIDETHVTAVAIPGEDHSVAHIRQGYEMMSVSPSD